MAPPTISHLILNTANYEAMKQWYLDVFEAKIGVETSDHSACFLQMDESHHRIGMFNVAKTDESAAMTSPGEDTGVLSRLNHVAFEYPTLAELFGAHRRLVRSSILPAVSLNHGPTMSIYYQDPDRNVVELFYDNQYTDEQSRSSTREVTATSSAPSPSSLPCWPVSSTAGRRSPSSPPGPPGPADAARQFRPPRERASRRAGR